MGYSNAEMAVPGSTLSFVVHQLPQKTIAISSRFSRRFFDRLHLLLLGVDGNVLAFDVQPQPVVNTDVLICDPHQREKRNHIPAPVWENELEARNHQEQRGYVMAQAIFAGE